MKQNLIRHHDLMVALFCLLACAYFFVYSGRHSFNDELQMFDTTASIVDFGDAKYDLAMWYVWGNYGRMGQNIDELYPLITSPIEPILSASAVPLYWLASQTDRVGLLHTTFLFNILIGAGACVLFFIYAIVLGYRDREALIGALLLGTCTVLFPYTKTFLREPLALFFALLTALMAELAYQQPTIRPKVAYGAGAIVFFALGFLTKESNLMLLPMVLFFIIPKIKWDDKRLIRLGDMLFILSVIAVLVMIYTPLIQTIIPMPFMLSNYIISAEYIPIALHSYLFSLNGSLWGTSPILLLALIGGWWLIQKGQRRVLWGVWIGVLGMVVGHAITTERHWFGGATLPPRFIIPLIPFVMLLILPVIDRLLHKPPRWLLLITGALILISLYWQSIHVAFDWRLYPKLLPPESNQLTTWLPSLNMLQYARPVLMTQLFGNTPLDFAWMRTQTLFIPIASVIIGIFASLALIYRRDKGWGLVMKLIIPIVLMFIGGLATIINDPAHFGDKRALHAVGQILDEQEVQGDILLLNDPVYVPFFLNYRPFDDVRVVSVQSSPGERASYEQTPLVISDDVRDLLAPNAPDLIDALMVARPRLWVLMDTSPFLGWAIRPVERYLSQYYYLIREVPTGTDDATVRLLEYATTRAPNPQNLPEMMTDFVFDGQLRLDGFTLPNGNGYAQGSILPISLQWSMNKGIQHDYRVALFLVDETGFIHVQGADSAPMGGFMPTNTFRFGDIVQDNRALRLPSALPSGEYRLWVRVYYFADDNTLVNGILANGDDIAVLPISIIIQP
ncbi:MAG: hypothetical protein CUN52_01860 [Phototrophicales bacterium]|nr:MAG: hypothetical protein CUN52_01860 [Phototrophicales bacterium]